MNVEAERNRQRNVSWERRIADAETIVMQLAQSIVEDRQAIDKWQHELAAAHNKVLDEQVARIGEERTHRLQLAREQRDYVDGADRHLLAYIDAFISGRTFWRRLRWVFLGK